MKKSRLAILLILILIFTSLAPAALAATILYESDFSYNDSTEKYDLHFTVDENGAVTITGKGAIESYAFASGCVPRMGWVEENFYTSVSVGDQVTSVGEGAFCWNYGLESVTLGKSVETIEASAFCGCSALTSITLPASLTRIDEWAFDACDSLTDVYFKGTKQQWNMVAISGFNPSLFSAAIHCSDGDVTYDLSYSIDDDGVLTFTGTGYCLDSFGGSGITKVVINDGLLGMFDNCFEYCYDLKAFEVSSGNPKYSSKDGVLFNKDKTTLIAYPISKSGKYSVPSGVKTIASWAFTGASISSITLPSGLESIGYYAFGNTDGFSSITIPASVKEIAYDAFGNCTSLTSISVNSSNKYYSSKDGVLFNKNKTTLIVCPAGKSGKYSVPSGVTNISYDAFRGCSALTEVTLSKGVINIENGAFASCSSLKKITLPQTLSYLADDAFRGCDALETVNYGGTMEEFDALFASSTSANAPLLFAKIVCSDGTITLDELNGYLNYDEPVTFTLTRAGKLTVSGAGEWDSFAFEENMAIKEATLESGVDEIGQAAFFWCENLKKITIPKSVKYIYDMAFYSCSALTDVYYAGTKADWEKLLQISVAAGYNIFDEYEALSWATVHCSDGDWICDGEFIGDDTSIPESFDMVLPKNITEIGAQAFCGDTITSVYIPNGCQKIGKHAFKDCESLRFIRVPASVSFIADDAFEGCDGRLTFIVSVENDYATEYAESRGFTVIAD